MSIENALSEIGKGLDRLALGIKKCVAAVFLKCFKNKSQRNGFKVVSPYLVLAFDSLLAFLSIFVSIHLRVGMDFLDYSPAYILRNMLVFGLVSTSVFLWVRTYQELWRYTTVEDVVPIFMAVVLSNLFFFPLMILMNQSDFLPYSVLIINVFVLTTSLMLPRLLCRMFYRQKLGKMQWFEPVTTKNPQFKDVPRVILIGNIPSVEEFCVDVMSNENISFKFVPVGIITMRHAEVGRTVRGIPIIGELRDIQRVIHDLGNEGVCPKHIVITEKELSDGAKKFVVRYARSSGIMLLHVMFHYSLDEVSE